MARSSSPKTHAERNSTKAPSIAVELDAEKWPEFEGALRRALAMPPQLHKKPKARGGKTARVRGRS